MTPYLDTWCLTCRTWHSSVWVHLGNRMVKVNDIDAALFEDDAEWPHPATRWADGTR